MLDLMRWSRKELGRLLREVRLSAGMSTRALAEASGIESSKINRAERGETLMELPDVEALVEACGRHLIIRADEPAGAGGTLSDVLSVLDADQLDDVETLARALPRLDGSVRELIVREARRALQGKAGT